ncbi:hypothetical protein N2152v2_001345 [Parachlorella kessleri]
MHDMCQGTPPARQAQSCALLCQVEAGAKVDESVRVLRAAVATNQVPPADVLQAMLKLEKAKVKLGEDWAEVLGGSHSPGRRWRLVFTSGTKERRLFFDFDKLCLKLGPKTFEIPIKQKVDASSFKPGKDLPFFTFAYADEKMIVARGRGGGLAVWERTSPSWELKNGIV